MSILFEDLSSTHKTLKLIEVNLGQIFFIDLFVEICSHPYKDNNWILINIIDELQ